MQVSNESQDIAIGLASVGKSCSRQEVLVFSPGGDGQAGVGDEIPASAAGWAGAGDEIPTSHQDTNVKPVSSTCNLALADLWR